MLIKPQISCVYVQLPYAPQHSIAMDAYVRADAYVGIILSLITGKARGRVVAHGYLREFVGVFRGILRFSVFETLSDCTCLTGFGRLII